MKNCENVTLSPECFEEQKFDWITYLQEGSEKYKLPSDDSESTCYSIEENFGNVIVKNLENCCLNNSNTNPALIPNQIFDLFPQKEVIENSDDVLRKNIIAANNSKLWLLNNTQHSWWTENFATNCLYPLGKFGMQWEQQQRDLYGSNKTNVLYYNEHNIIRELMSLFVMNMKYVNERSNSICSEISVPSLIQASTRAVVEDALKAVKSYRKLSEYCHSIFKKDLSQLTFSHRAYAMILKELCEDFLMKVENEENIMRKQNDSYTFLTFYNNLHSNFCDINFICEIHEYSLWDNEKSNCKMWFTVVRLLSRIFHKLQETTCAKFRKILLRIFLKIFEAYARIIDNWFTKGKLEDQRNEFFIQKDHESNTYIAFLDENLMKQNEKDIAPFFYQIASELMNCSHNIEFLCKVDQLRCIQEEILANGKFIDNLIHKITECLFSPIEEIKSYTDRKLNQKIDVVPKQFVEISATTDFLIQAYANVFEILEIPNVTRSLNLINRSGEELNSEQTNMDVFPASTALEHTLCSLISDKTFVIAKRFKMSIVDDYKLFDHVRGLSDLLLMDLHSMHCKLIMRLDNQVWEGSHVMKNFLYDCIESNRLPFGYLVRFNISKENLFSRINDAPIRISDLIRCIDQVSLEYTVSWPINMIITSSIISNFYDPLFKLIFKINFVYFAISRLSFKDLPRTRLWRGILRRMNMLRHWVLLLLQKLRSYAILIIPQCLDKKLIESGIEINTCVELETNYWNYLEKMKEKCLVDAMKSNTFNAALDRVWRVCDDVRELWLKGMNLQFNNQEISQAVELYVQCLWYLTETFRKIAEGKRFNHPLNILYSDFQLMMDNHLKNIPENLSL